ncbi:MAG: glycosyltransferase family 2 protein [Gammaproteobacteria bacterium]|nr:MAG: glycosyltransferase family 2 protein [Gammaproteobacteria bacterium]
MAKISACIISFNEEKKIEECLKSLQPVVDEIIIIDSLSTDDTLKIAEKYTDKIFQQKFLGHIEQKNLALKKASNDWILSLDCDERLSEELQQSILEIKDKLEHADAYRMPRKTFYIYRWLNHCWYPDIKTRLFNRNTSHWGGTNPHDHIVTEGKNIVRLKGDIFHLSFDSISDHLKTIDSFTEIGADELVRKNRTVTIFSPLTHASWTFFKLYIIKRGFLDGFAGLIVSVLSYMHVFIKYSKAHIKYKQLKHEQARNK